MYLILSENYKKRLGVGYYGFCFLRLGLRECILGILKISCLIRFNTRNILNTLKPNGTYKIKYYGWREGYNSGVPNILSVEEIIDESNCTNHSISDYMI